MPLPGGDFGLREAPLKTQELLRDYPFLSASQAGRLIRLYGTCAWAIMGDAGAEADLGTVFGHGLTQAEVDYLINREWACTAQDILWRRTKLGLHFSAEEEARLAQYLTERTAHA